MILFVDDETREVRDYVNELELSGYDVTFKDNVDEALAIFDRELTEINLIILDLMMPPGTSFERTDTQMGLRTGVSVYKRIREKAPDLWVFILTNVSDEEVAKKFRNEPKCRFLSKEEFLPLQLVEKVKEVLPNPEPQR